MYNKVQLLGRLGADPELKSTNSGKDVVRMSVATTYGYGDKQRTDWHSVVAWEKTAQMCDKYLSKGRFVFIEGRLQTREFETKDGDKRKVTEIVAFEVKFLPDGSGKKKQQEQERPDAGFGDDDIPF